MKLLSQHITTFCHPDKGDTTKDLKRSLLILFMLFLFILPSKSQNIDASSLMQTANNAYDAGLYDSALNVYHLIEKENLEASAL